jgi:hypothetical protein
MKNMLLGLGLACFSVASYAELPQQLQGRYALDCQMEKAAELSYIVGDKTLVRLVEGLATPHVSVPKAQRVVPINYQQLSQKQYGKDQVTFYQFEQHNYAFVESKYLLSFLRPDNKVLLKQCL